ncbi:hypothetical protein [Sulfuriflexus sp.]|uniref:hypothetical protein n=1 Tax=Sulfuriflexus sp. TaxID=2015443 RepID=UPI0028CFA520|nr:hypothetical protein [Sulfuriflexus sp.]MDT8403848.1 hypothetical protein [Sulfuriflexus sp.]
MAEDRLLMSIVEVGGYQNLLPLYTRLGFQVETVHQMRKAMSMLKKRQPAAIVAEFNFQSDFRDRTSSLESLLATVERLQFEPVIVVFYEKEYAPQFERLHGGNPQIKAIPFPIDEATLEAALGQSAL